MKTTLAIVVLALFALFLIAPGTSLGQSTEELKTLRKELEEIKKGQTAIQKELQEIKSLLQGRQAPPPAQPLNVVLTVDGDPFKGDKNAKLTLIEFSDYQCPFCARHLSQTWPQIEQDYVKTGKLKYVLRDFPIQSIHPQAFKGHEAAHCAGEQGKYWEMHERLFGNQKAMGPKELLDHAQRLAIDTSRFQQCLDGGKYAAKIRKDIADAQKVGVQGTPAFFLGYTEPDATSIKALRMIRGAQPYAAFKEAIESLLSGQK